MTRKTLKKSAIFSAFLATLIFSASSVMAQTPPGKEKCYGVSLASQDDGSEDAGPIPGMSTKDYQGDAYKFVTEGTCKAIMTPFGAGNTSPIAGRPPKAAN